MVARTGRLVAAFGAVLGSLVLAHSIVFLVRYGSAFGEALAHNGHDVAWSIAVWSSIVFGTALGLGGAFQLWRLGRASHPTSSIASVGAADVGGLNPRTFARSWLWTAGRLAGAVGILLTIQENFERASAGMTVPGIGLLVSEEYPWALPIVIAVGLVAGLVVSLFRWRRDVLLARIRAARLAQARSGSALRPRQVTLRPVASILGRARGLRAPPLAFLG